MILIRIRCHGPAWRHNTYDVDDRCNAKNLFDDAILMAMMIMMMMIMMMMMEM